MSSNDLTSLSLLAFLFSKGSASRLSKLGSPLPGMRTLERPAACPMVSMSWNGVNRADINGRWGIGWVMYRGGIVLAWKCVCIEGGR